jgi:FkbM family methyltransferase
MQDSDTARDRFFEAAGHFTPLVAVDSFNVRYVVSTADHTVGRRLFRRTARGEMVILARAVAALETLGQGHWVDGTTFLDLGANIGTSALTALRSHSFARAVACEPERENCRLLRANAVLNDVDDLMLVLQVAVSDSTGVSQLALTPTNSGGHFVVANGHQEHATTSVETVSVDYLVTRGVLDPGEVGMIWIDAQGHEGHILKGAGELVSRGIPIVLEFHPEMLTDAGGQSAVEEIIGTNYTHFVDLRTVDLRHPSKVQLQPAGDISSFAKGFGDKGGAHHTDILSVRRD